MQPRQIASQSAKPDSRRRFRDHVVFDLEVLLQDVQDAPRRVVLDLEQRHGSVPHVLEAPIDRFEQVVRIALPHDDVGVANDAEQVRRDDVDAGEEILKVGLDDVFEKHERPAAAGQRSRQLDEARERVRHLHPGELRAMPVSDDDGQVAAAVRNIRERMARVERQRRQHRADRRVEVLLEEDVYLRRVVLPLEKVDVLFGQQRLQLAPSTTEVVEHLAGRVPDRLHPFLDLQTVGRDGVHAGPPLAEQAGETHHVELVEVVRGDGEELHALEQRLGAVARLRQHARVERQPAQFAVDVQRGIAEVWVRPDGAD